jgi:hypothetical protein
MVSDGPTPFSSNSSVVTADETANAPEFAFRFSPPHDAIEAGLSCVDAISCNALHFSPANPADWPVLQQKIGRIRSFVFDHEAMAEPAPLSG